MVNPRQNHPMVHPAAPKGAFTALAVREAGSVGTPKRRLLDESATPSASGSGGYVAALHDVSTTQIYTPVLNQGPAGLRSPADQMEL